MHRKRRGAVEDPKAPAGLAKSRRKEKPLASRNVGLQAPPAPQVTHIPQDTPLAQPGSTVLAQSTTLPNSRPLAEFTVQDLLQRQELPQQLTEGNHIYMQFIHNVGLHVGDSIKQNILQGKYIELQTLLPPTGSYGRNIGHKKLVFNNMREIMVKDNIKTISSIE